MTPERWQQIKLLFESVLERNRAERTAFLDHACMGDPDLRGEIESLLASHEEADAVADDLALDIDQGLLGGPEDDENVGRRFGPYEVIEEIGRGGMGYVFLGIRADDQYQKRVAIKLIRGGMRSEFLVRRFRTERQILANLDHPNIAKLLDGGATPDGMPYLVMEFIEGVPIDEYCNVNRLPTADRLKMFRQVCSAVSYAHQNLVIHRDLKPSNILVTADGVPKLLDFGIAKLLDPSRADEETGTAMGMMTPEYASPEQVRGQSITTASDVYSLGVVLYRLISGRHPYRIRSRVPEEILRVVCEEDPLKPSAAVTMVVDEATVAGSAATKPIEEGSQSLPEDGEKLRRRLSGDLDMIVMMALRKEPERRYSSVEQFSEDIRRHLEGLPVIAAKNTLGYQTRKFITRHKVGVSAAALVALAMLGGVWQAFSARTERQRARQVSSDLSAVVESFMFQVDDSIQNLQGATPARELLVTKALGYLDGLAQQAGADPENNRRLASAYLRVGDIQGRPGFPNIGDKAGALVSYTKAVDILKKLAERFPSDASLQRDLAVSYERSADTFQMTGKSDLALDNYKAELALRENLLVSTPSDKELKIGIAGAYQRIGELTARAGDIGGAVEIQRKGLATMEQLIKDEPGAPEVRRSLDISYIKVGDALAGTGDFRGAIDSYRKAVPICEGLHNQFPDNARYRRELTISYDKVGNAMSAFHDPAGAREFYEKSMKDRLQLAASDPRNAEARRDLSVSYVKIGKTFADMHMTAQALDFYQKALANDQKLHDEDPANDQAFSDLTDSMIKVAEMQAEAGNTAAAIDNYQKATAIREQLSHADPNNVSFKTDLAEAYSEAAELYSKLGSDQHIAPEKRLGNWRRARELYSKSLAVISALRDAHQLGDDGADQGADLQRSLAKCDQAMANLASVSGPR
ncbi:MAG TPA: protein kinase [Blastocatellia bacterium]|nr:protein kinase [Blastocatellia bacterium]